MDTQVVLTIVCAIFASQGFWAWLMNRNAKKSAKTKLIMGLGYDAICRKAEEYMVRGRITKEEYHDFEKYLYKPYKDMGGDGTADRLMDEMKKIPIVQ